MLVSIVLAGLVIRYSGEILVVAKAVERPDAIVVLASHEWERLPVAAQLARQHRSTRLLLTLPEHVTEHNCHKCSDRVSWLDEAGIEPQRVTVLPQRVENTYDEAGATTAFVSGEPIDRLVIVTSPYHGRRALATFEHRFKAAGLQTTLGLAAPMRGIDPARWWLHRYDRDYVAYEWAGIVYYTIWYGVLPTV